MASMLGSVVRNGVLASLALAAGWLGATPAEACTTFYVDHDGPTMGKSYDWDTSRGLVFINKRGWARKAMIVTGGDVPAEWTSQYASISFNQYGYLMPNGGINEAGLAVDIMVLNDTVYPAQDTRPILNQAQWVQYVLDNFGSVAELVAAADGLRISPVVGIGFHYLACDSTGDCAAFEYLDGQLVVTPSATMPVKTLTNDTYQSSQSFLAQHEGFGGTQPIPDGMGSLDRFVRASWLAAQPATQPAPDATFAIIDSVQQGSYSPWHLVYRLADRGAYFRTYTSPSVKYVNLSSFDLNCYSGIEMLDIDDAGSGDVAASFVPFDPEVNTQLLEEVVAGLADYLPPGTTQVMVNLVSDQPNQETCTIEPGGGSGGGTAGVDDDDEDDDDGDEGGCTVSAAGTPGGRWHLLGLLGISFGFARRFGRRI